MSAETNLRVLKRSRNCADFRARYRLTVMDLFKTDADLEAESARPKSPVSRRRKVVPLAVAACCAAAAFPLGDAAQGTNLLFGPLAAAGITGLISWRSVPGGSAALAFVAALLTSAFMLAAVFVALLLFGV